MPEPSPALIDIIAAAIANADGRLDEYERNAPGVRRTYRTRARAALAAMPQPIAHGILVHRYVPEAAWIIGPYDRTEADQVAAREPDLGLGTITVVALVPVQTPQNAAHATHHSKETK